MDRESLGKVLVLPDGCLFVAAMERAALCLLVMGAAEQEKNNGEFPWEFRD